MSELGQAISQLQKHDLSDSEEMTKKAYQGLMWRLDHPENDSSCPQERRISAEEMINVMEHLGLVIPQWLIDRGNGPVAHSGRTQWAKNERKKKHRESQIKAEQMIAAGLVCLIKLDKVKPPGPHRFEKGNRFGVGNLPNAKDRKKKDETSKGKRNRKDGIDIPEQDPAFVVDLDPIYPSGVGQRRNEERDDLISQGLSQEQIDELFRRQRHRAHRHSGPTIDSGLGK